MAVAGQDYCVVAASTRMSTGFSILKRDSSLLLPLCALADVGWPDYCAAAVQQSHCTKHEHLCKFLQASVSTFLLCSCWSCAMVCFVSRVCNHFYGSQEGKGFCVLGSALSKGSVVMPNHDNVEAAPLLLLTCEHKVFPCVTAL